MDRPGTAESVRLFLEKIQGSRNRRFGLIFFKANAGINGPPIWFEFIKGDGWTHERPNRSKFLKRTAGIHGPPIWSDFSKRYAGTHGRSNQANF